VASECDRGRLHIDAAFAERRDSELVLGPLHPVHWRYRSGGPARGIGACLSNVPALDP
jgi:hypothetical protein